MVIKGSSELYEDVHKKDLCVDCGACVGLCPYFVSYKGKIARLFPCTLPEGRCYAHCPKTEIDPEQLSQSLFGKPYDGSPLGHLRKVFKTRAGNKLIDCSGFQNGGTVTALTLAALESGRIDAAALTRRRGLDPEPFLARTKDEVLFCSGSKYMASPTLSSVNAYTVSGGKKLGVVGTPCQMTALTRMRMNPLNRDDHYDPVALTIGLFCTWALDTRKLTAQLHRQVATEDILSMDVPPPPASVMTLKTRSGDLEIPLDEIRKAVPTGCMICPDMTAEFSDLSVGALEGNSGWNTLIVRTEQGEALLEESVAKGYLECDALPEDNLSQLEKGARGKKKRALSIAKDMGLLNADPASGRSALIINPDLVQTMLEVESCQP